jgi:hypothetical protein
MLAMKNNFTIFLVKLPERFVCKVCNIQFIHLREREKETRKGRGVVKDTSYTQALWGRQSIAFLEGSQASPARPSGKSSLK